ncbi:MAG: DUF962 domain-containing protein [Moraxellaceae bacterium]|jgi:uncharacterized membrane protein YGL010W|nr:DUF962 domain-containing protein [Moraxellaceae bacterium]MBK9184951.1 DUF962 domain-containing protein [Moraxellaceae bacterium]MBL0231721.1 DUF962 domain-containing protein [Moraxellaceae bacterium]
MLPIKLNADWSQLMAQYQQDHQDPRNQFCHSIGIPLIAASLPVGATIVGLPLAVPMFTVGWGFQFVGHYFEGKKPSFVDDRRQLLVGVLWWTKKMGLKVVQTQDEAN